MSGKYNLNDNVNDSFEFEVGGYTYVTSYPTMEQIEQLQDIMKDIEDKKAKGEKVDDEEGLSWMYQFIKPLNPESPPIGEVMKKQNVRVLRNFNKMLRTEFGVE